MPRTNGTFGKSLTPRIVQSFDKFSAIQWQVDHVPGISGKQISVAVDDVRIAPIDNTFAYHVCQSIGQKTQILEDLISWNEEIDNNGSKNINSI